MAVRYHHSKFGDYWARVKSPTSVGLFIAANKNNRRAGDFDCAGGFVNVADQFTLLNKLLMRLAYSSRRHECLKLADTVESVP